jgi:hypothetical protein
VEPMSSDCFRDPCFPGFTLIKPDYRSFILPHPIRSIEVLFQRRNHGDIRLIFLFGFSVSKKLWRLPSSLPSREPGPCCGTPERRRRKTASIFTRFSTIAVRVHLSTPKGFVEIRHARRRENPS